MTGAVTTEAQDPAAKDTNTADGKSRKKRTAGPATNPLTLRQRGRRRWKSSGAKKADGKKQARKGPTPVAIFRRGEK